MRILHTADWHLGMSAHGEFDAVSGVSSRLLDMAKTVEWIGTVAEERQVQVVAIAGDLTHRKFLTGAELDIVLKFLYRMARANILVVIGEGNHDGYSHPGVPSTVAALNGINPYVRTFAEAKPTYLSANERMFVIPYPNRAVLAAAGYTSADVSDILSGWLSEEGCSEGDYVMAHLSVSSAKFSANAQPLLMGAADITVNWSSLVRDGMGGVLLGHIHMPQVINDILWYAGAPMCFDYGDGEGKRGVCIVEDGKRERLVNPHNRLFQTFTPERIEFEPEAIIPGSFLRITAEREVDATERAEWARIAAHAGATLTHIIEKRAETVRTRVKEVADAVTDEDIVRRWFEVAAEGEDAETVLALMEKADEEAR